MNSSSDTEKPPTPGLPRALMVSVVETASLTVVDASPIGTPLEQWPRIITLKRGDIISVRRATIDDDGQTPQNKAYREVEMKNTRLSWEKESPKVRRKSGHNDGSITGIRANRFLRLRDNRFLRPDLDQHMKEAIRSPPKKERQDTPSSHKAGPRRTYRHQVSKFETDLSDKGSHEPPVENEAITSD